MKDPKAIAPTMIPVTNPFLVGKYSQQTMRVTIYYKKLTHKIYSSTDESHTCIIHKHKSIVVS